MGRSSTRVCRLNVNKLEKQNNQIHLNRTRNVDYNKLLVDDVVISKRLSTNIQETKIQSSRKKILNEQNRKRLCCFSVILSVLPYRYFTYLA